MSEGVGEGVFVGGGRAGAALRFPCTFNDELPICVRFCNLVLKFERIIYSLFIRFYIIKRY